MAGTCSPVIRHVIGSTVVELSRTGPRTGAPLAVRISPRNYAVSTTAYDGRNRVEGPSCIFIGPVETASQENLEALYCQARDAYYSGQPLIVDDMFDKIELKLRWYGSKCVVKYPRCSLRQQSTYADAEGRKIPHKFLHCSRVSHVNQSSTLELLAPFNGILFMLFGSVVGYPIASASVGALKGLWKHDLVALKGVCPNCGEEVFAFVKSDHSNLSPHRAECHVCESSLEFRAKVEQSTSRPGRQWVHGRIYLIRPRVRRP